MPSHLLVLAEAADPSGDASSGVTKILQDFGVSVPNILAQILSFTIVAIVLWKFAFKPILATLDERQRKISDGLKYAEDMKAKLDAAKQDYETHLREAQQKAQQILAEAQKAAKDFSEAQQKEATERANGLITRAQETIELEKKRMLAEARAEIARLVVATSQRVLSRELSEADRARYNESAVRELTQV